jgi:hypothetical protein
MFSNVSIGIVVLCAKGLSTYLTGQNQQPTLQRPLGSIWAIDILYG